MRQKRRTAELQVVGRHVDRILMIAAVALLTAQVAPAAQPSGVLVPLAEWERTPPLDQNSAPFQRMQLATDSEWRVTATEAGPIASQWTRETLWSEIPPCVVPNEDYRQDPGWQLVAFQVEDGFLVGSDSGEWGGSAWWTDSTCSHTAPLFEENVIGFTRFEGDIVAITGLAHLGLRLGAIHRLRRVHGRWRETERVDLGGAAYAFTLDKSEGLVIVTSLGLVRYRHHALRILAPGDRGLLYPNSVVEVGRKFYVGMRSAVAEFSPAAGGFSEMWLVPPKP